jgi:hypothetical protein
MHHLDIAHMIVSSLIHGLIYAAIFKAFHHLSLAGAAAVAIVGVAAVWIVTRMFSRR